MTTGYRPDIDGLRALAVLLVIVFHAFPKALPSGFIGVDVFFVISGYLISSIITGGLRSGRFTFADFYSKRILRIFPALLFVLLFVLVFSWFTLVSGELRVLGKHVFAASTFTSNFFLWNEAGYFDQSSDLKPLLHLWSLAIEEQFYLLYPLFLWWWHRKGYRFSSAVILVGLLSMGVNLGLAGSMPYADFYMPFSRFWELMAGAWIADRDLRGAPEKPENSSVWSIAGISLLAAGVVVIKEGSGFPGFLALLPVAGAAFLIRGGCRAFPNRILSKPFFVKLGKISYPLYLWHWPLLSIPRIIEGDSPNRYFRVVFVLLAAGLAWITTRFIENPIRFGGERGRKVVFLLGAMAATGGAGLAIQVAGGFPSRDSGIQTVLREGQMGHEEYHRHHLEHFFPCTPARIYEAADVYSGTRRCFQSKPSGGVDIAIIGDSHAEQLFAGFAELLPAKNTVYYLKPSLPMIENGQYRDIFDEVLGNRGIRKVFIDSYWHSKGFSARDFLPTIDRLIAAGKEVYLFDDIPDFGFDPDRCRIRRRFRAEVVCGRSKAGFLKEVAPVHAGMQELKALRPALRLVFSAEHLCGTDQCSMLEGNRLLYRDSNHLNLEGSRLLVGRILKATPGIAD